MTRPATLSEAAERIAAGGASDRTLAEFLDAFYAEPSAAKRLTMLAEEPALGDDLRLNALLGAIGEYLAKQFRLPGVPAWVGGPHRVLAEPWFTAPADSDGMREYLSISAPAEFVHHNIFTEPMPLRRAGRRDVAP